MRVPEPIRFIYQQVFGGADRAGPVPPPPFGVAAAAAAPVPPREARRGPLPEVTYQQELDQRRRQERLDADLARRLQLASLLDPDDNNHVNRRHGVEQPGLGNVAGHFLNEDFVQNAANVVMGAFGDAEYGRRGERPSRRQRRSRHAGRNDEPDFLGDGSVGV